MCEYGQYANFAHIHLLCLLQEAKSSCAGQWYLPAGRMEPGEDIVEAAKREVLEETGMNFDPSTLILVEVAGGNWYRSVRRLKRPTPRSC